MSVDGMASTGRSMSYYLRLQEVAADNLANANTDAFKAIRVAARIDPATSVAVPVEEIDLQQGSFRETGRPLDVGLEGPGFFVVGTEQGERLTRGGSFRLDGESRLTDLHGNPVLGTDGAIVLHGVEAQIQPDGTITVDGSMAGRLRIETVEDPSTLSKEGGGRFIPDGPLVPVSMEGTQVRQGMIEEANLDPLLSTVDLLTIQRAYAANADALRAMDSVLGVVASDVGHV
jgi:flagellar basal body rod protein FlgG